jgi:hypothetical protein
MMQNFPISTHHPGKLGSLLPVQRVAAGVKTGDHDQGAIFDDKKQRVRKAAQEGPANIFQDDRKLPRIIAHAFDQGVNRLAETSA